MIDFITCDPHLLLTAERLADVACSESFVVRGPTGCGHHAFARWVGKKSSQLRPFIYAHCASIKGVRDLQRHFVRAAWGDLFLHQLELLSPALHASLRYFSRSDPSVRIIASWEKQICEDELPATLAELFSTQIQLRRLKERQGEIPYMLNQLAHSYALGEFSDEEIHYIEQHTLSLHYSQFISCVQCMCEIALSQGKGRVDEAIVYNVVAGSKKMLSYAQLLHHGNFCRLFAETKFRGMKETLLLLEAAIIAKTLNETFNCLAHTARILHLPVNTLSSRQKVLAPHIEVFKRLLVAQLPGGG